RENYTQGSSFAYSASTNATSTITTYQAGSYANGSYSLNSLLYSSQARRQTSAQQTIDLDYNGSGTFTTNGSDISSDHSSYGRLATGGTRNFGYASSGSFTTDSQQGSTASQSSTGTVSLYAAGTLDGLNYNLSSLALDDASTFAATYRQTSEANADSDGTSAYLDR